MDRMLSAIGISRSAGRSCGRPNPTPEPGGIAGRQGSGEADLGRYAVGLGSILPLLAGLLACQTPAHAANAISHAIERAQPCKDIKTSVLGASIGVDRFESATLQTLKVDVVGDDAKVGVTGSLSCKTSDNATVPGSASVTFSASIELDLNSCALKQNTFEIKSTGGRYGFVIDAFKGRIEQAVRDSIAEQTKPLCNR